MLNHFNRIAVAVCSTVLLGSVFLLAQAPRGGQPAVDPPNPVFWSAQQIRDIASTLKPRVDPETHNAGTALIPSANLIYREGDSGSEIHEKVADIIFVHEGQGTILVGGKMIGGKQDRQDEIRGTSIEGGTRYPVAGGDSIYIPANMPHQFFVEKGKHFVITIVKVPPQR
jgi:mannose-6-phosphate isomerase-like protein (cupin superfamily)